MRTISGDWMEDRPWHPHSGFSQVPDRPVPLTRRVSEVASEEESRKPPMGFSTPLAAQQHGYARSGSADEGPLLDYCELFRRDLHGCGLVDVQVRL